MVNQRILLNQKRRMMKHTMMKKGSTVIQSVEFVRRPILMMNFGLGVIVVKGGIMASA